MLYLFLSLNPILQFKNALPGYIDGYGIPPINNNTPYYLNPF